MREQSPQLDQVVIERLEQMATPDRHDGPMVQSLRREAANLANTLRARATQDEEGAMREQLVLDIAVYEYKASWCDAHSYPSDAAQHRAYVGQLRRQLAAEEARNSTEDSNRCQVDGQ